MNLSVDNGCGTSQKSKQITILSMSVDDINASDEIQVFPIPAKNVLFVEIKDFSGENIMLYDATGKLLINKKTLGESTIELNVSNLASGLYFIRYGERQIKVLIQ